MGIVPNGVDTLPKISIGCVSTPFGIHFSRLSTVHERYRQTDDRRTDDDGRHIANMNVSSRLLKTDETFATLSVMYSGDGAVTRDLVRRTADQSSKNIVDRCV